MERTQISPVGVWSGCSYITDCWRRHHLIRDWTSEEAWVLIGGQWDLDNLGRLVLSLEAEAVEGLCLTCPPQRGEVLCGGPLHLWPP